MGEQLKDHEAQDEPSTHPPPRTAAALIPSTEALRELRAAPPGMGTGAGMAPGQGSWHPSRAAVWPCKRRDREGSQPAAASPPHHREGGAAGRVLALSEGTARAPCAGRESTASQLGVLRAREELPCLSKPRAALTGVRWEFELQHSHTPHRLAIPRPAAPHVPLSWGSQPAQHTAGRMLVGLGAQFGLRLPAGS